MIDEQAYKNEDIELWRETKDDYYSPSIHVTKYGKIGMDVGGFVVVADVRTWHHWAMEKHGCLCTIETQNEKCPVHFPLKNKKE